MSSNPKKSFLDRMIERVDKLDSNSVQAYILHLSRERGFFETVFNAVQEGILVIDRRLKICYHNQAAKELLGLPDDLEKVRVSQFLQNVDWRRILNLEAEEWLRLSRQEVEILYPSHRYLQFYLVPQAEDPSLATVILRDVTETRKRAMRELEDETFAFVAMLAGEVAHEIGNPLNSLYLNLQLLNHMFEPGSEPEVDDAKEMLSACRDEVERLDKIISQFLHAIRPGKEDHKPLDLKKLLIETLRFTQTEIESRNCEIKCHFPNILPRINGDAARLKQAFFNILRNAVQAMPQGGKIDVNCSYDDDDIIVAFADSGHGISHEKLNQIFDPFKSFRKGGTGLGMMIVEKVLREHGASSAIDTREDEGTAVVIKFPRSGRRMRVLQEPSES